MPKTSRFTIFALALMMGMAHAAALGNGPPDQSGGSDLNAFLEADSFVISGVPQELFRANFWALASSPADFAGSVDWAFYSDLSGAPDSVLFNGNASALGTATGNTSFGLNEYLYTFGLDVTLSPGTYWLGLHNGPSNTLPSTSFYWAWSNGIAGNSVSFDIAGGGPWAGNSAALAFELLAPEPVSGSLVGGSLLAAWLIRRGSKGLRG